MSKNQEIIVLSIFPLSFEFRNKITEIHGDSLKFLLVSELIAASPLKIWKKLRNVRTENLFLAFPHPNIKLFLPLLKVFSLLTKAKKIWILENDAFITFSSKSAALLSITRLISQTILFFFSFLKCQNEVSKLSQKTLIHFPLNISKSILYLDATVRTGPKTGGSIGHIAGVANGLAQKGFNVDYFAEDKIPCLNSSIGFIKLKLPALFTYPVELNRLRINNLMINQITKNKINPYHFIYQRMTMKNYAGVKLSRMLKIPLIMEYNGPLVWCAEQWEGKLNKIHFKELALKCEQICLNHAHLVVTISEAAEEILLHLGVPARRILCYPNCIDPTIFNPTRYSVADNLKLRHKFNIPPSAIVITFIGTFGLWHGVDVMSMAIRHLLDHHRATLEQNQVYFLLIGNGNQEPLVRTILETQNSQPHVIFTGTIPQEEAPAFLAISDIFLSPQVRNPDGSRFFGSPTKLFEYMAMEKPIIASDLEQIGHILKNSLKAHHLPESTPNCYNLELGILAEPGNVQHIVDSLLFLIKNQNWRLKLGQNARNEALAKYTWSLHVEQILDRLGSLN